MYNNMFLNELFVAYRLLRKKGLLKMVTALFVISVK
jgi:hypothetical protein